MPVQHQECGTDYFPPPLTQVPIPPLNLLPCPAAPPEFLGYSGHVDYSSIGHRHHHEQREQRVEHVSGDRARLHIHVSSGPPASSSHTRTRKVTRCLVLLCMPRFFYVTYLCHKIRSPLELACYFCRGRKIGVPFYFTTNDQVLISRCSLWMARRLRGNGPIEMLVSELPPFRLLLLDDFSVMLTLFLHVQSECYRREQDCRYPSVRALAMPHTRVLTSRIRSRVVDNEES